MKNSWWGIAQVMGAGLCFGTLGSFARLGFAAGLSIDELLTFRFALAALLLGIGLAVFRPQWLLLGRRQTLISLALGVFGYPVFSTLYFISIQGIPIGLAALLLFSFPLFVNLGAWIFFKESPHLRQVVSVLLSSLGLICLVWGDWHVEKLYAVFCGMGAGVTYAAYVLISGRVQAQVRPLSSSFYVILASALTFIAIHHPSPLLLRTAPRILVVLGLAVIGTAMPLTLFLAGLQKMSSSKASILVMVEPIVGSLLGWVIFQETMNPLQASGAVLILVSMVFPGPHPGPTDGLV